jgi:hypothetical protein
MRDGEERVWRVDDTQAESWIEITRTIEMLAALASMLHLFRRRCFVFLDIASGADK